MEWGWEGCGGGGAVNCDFNPGEKMYLTKDLREMGFGWEGAKLEQVQRPWGSVCLESSTASKKASAACGTSRSVVRSGGEQTRAGGASELEKDSEVYSEHESMRQTGNLSYILVFSTWSPR